MAEATDLEAKRKQKAKGGEDKESDDAAVAAMNGTPNGSDPTGSIADRASEPVDEEDVEPDEPPIKGGRQMKLPGNFGKRKVPIRATLSISSAERDLDGMLDVEDEVSFIIRGKPGKLEWVPEHDSEGRIKGWKARQHVRVLHVKKVEDAAFPPED